MLVERQLESRVLNVPCHDDGLEKGISVGRGFEAVRVIPKVQAEDRSSISIPRYGSNDSRSKRSGKARSSKSNEQCGPDEACIC